VKTLIWFLIIRIISSWIIRLVEFIILMILWFIFFLNHIEIKFLLLIRLIWCILLTLLPIVTFIQVLTILIVIFGIYFLRSWVLTLLLLLLFWLSLIYNRRLWNRFILVRISIFLQNLSIYFFISQFIIYHLLFLSFIFI